MGTCFVYTSKPFTACARDTMDYSRPNHIPTPQELAAAARVEQYWLIAFAVAVAVLTIALTLLFGSKIA